MAVFFFFKMIIKGFIGNISCYTGKVYVGADITLMKKGYGTLAACNNKFVGELDPITNALLELYVPFVKTVSVVAIDLHDGMYYPIQINLDFNYVAF